ncbi:MAG: transcription termination/antitermination factor NusG [Candidatus Hydrogenedentota bacterium]|nr:MAG: transcription termination/antitermination factor NusG [Candidatus Hydrogenedentota bacterium]
MNVTQDNEEKKTQEQEQAESAEKEQPAEPEQSVSAEETQEQGEVKTSAPSETEEPSSVPSRPEGKPKGSEGPTAEETAQAAQPAVPKDEAETAAPAGEEAEGALPEQPTPESDTETTAETPVQQPVKEPGAVETEEAARTEQAVPAEEPAGKKIPVSRVREDRLTLLPEEGGEKRWYVIHAHSGHENKVRQSLENRVRQEHLDELVTQILVPSEEVAEVKGGKKRITSRKIFPGYVLVEMKLTYKTWYLIRTTPGVTGFIGSGKMPTPLEPEEIESIFEQMRGEQKKPKPKVSFEKDEKVKIIEGPFTNFMGYVDEVNPERGKLKVMVEIFERLTPVELEFWQVEKM